MRPIDVMLAQNRLWRDTPVGSGEDLNILIKYIEELEEQLKDGGSCEARCIC